LYKVAYRLAVKARAATASWSLSDTPVEQLLDPVQADEFLAAELRPILDDALSRLPEKYRVLLVLHYLQGKTVQQAAEELGCPSGTVSGRLARARELLRKRLVRKGMALSSTGFPGMLAQGLQSASMPAALAGRTLAAVGVFASKGGQTGTISAAVLALVESAGRTLSVDRWKVMMFVVVALGLAGLGLGLAGQFLARNPAYPTRLVGGGQQGQPIIPANQLLQHCDEDPLPQGARARLGTQRY
jgi:hypothetical protein